jgi:ABC-type Fe3+/spermidine/putrescine transport system ATPase subunit
MSFLRLQNITKNFGNTPVLNDISLELAATHTLAVLGRSGCGKTTLLKIIAGLLPGQGTVTLAGQDVTQLPPQQRGIVYLYQETLLFPHLNVFENVAFGLRLRHLPAADLQNQTEQMLVDLGLQEHARKMPTALSGGQRQRVAFGRALIIRPRLLLLDEPFGALDVETRTHMQDLYRRIAAEQQITAIFVTHDLKEALLMGHRWGYMDQGNLLIFNTLEAFLQDARTGIHHEIEFWKNLNPSTT